MRLDTEGGGELGDVGDGRVADAALDAADIGAVQPGLEGQFLLRQPLFETKSPDVAAELAANFHAAKLAALQTIGLQTISLIFKSPATMRS